MRTRITACVMLIELRQALLSYQDCHTLLLNLAGATFPASHGLLRAFVKSSEVSQFTHKTM